MSIHKLSRELESAVGDLFRKEEFLFIQHARAGTPAYIQALRLLKEGMPSAFQIQKNRGQPRIIQVTF